MARAHDNHDDHAHRAGDDPADLDATVRAGDPDRYRGALFAGPEGRAHLLALYAFNLEVARTREAVSEAMIGQIRLQWWREALEEAFAGGPVRRHPVAKALASTIGGCGLPRAPFDALIDAREADLEDRPNETLADLEAYADATSGGLHALAARALAPGLGEEGEAAARAAGTALALIGIARAVPVQAAQGRIVLPADLFARHDIDPHVLFDAGTRAAAAPVIRDVLDCALAHSARARVSVHEVPRAAVPALLPLTLAETHLARLVRDGGDPFASPDMQPGAGATVRLFLRALGGRY